MAKKCLDGDYRYSYQWSMRAPELLKAWRERNGLTQSALAERVCVRQPTLSEYEKGRRTPGVEIAFRIERVTEGAVPAVAWTEAAEPSPTPSTPPDQQVA